MELYDSEISPVPDGAVVGDIKTSDGVRLRYARWPSIGRRSLGTVCLFQGRAEFIEKYFEVITELRERGFAVATFDWRGQGGSERRLANPRKGYIDSFDEYDRDFDVFLQQVALPDCPPPHYALAHSTGGLICLRAAHDGRARFDRMVLVSPFVGLAGKRPSQRTVFNLVTLATALGLGELDMPGSRARVRSFEEFEGNPLTSDERRFAHTIALKQRFPQLAIGEVTFGWLHAAAKAIGEAAEPEFAAAINVPTLLVAGMRDGVAALGAIEDLGSSLRAGGLITLPGARHEVMMERDPVREQFWAAFDAFVPGGER